MNVSRELVYNALLALFWSGTPGTFNYGSRKFQHWSEVSDNLQPAVFVRAMDQNASQSYDWGLTKWTLHAQIYIYCKHSPSQGTIPGTPLMNLLDYVDAQLQPKLQGSLQNLGLPINNCFIDGNIVIDEGSLPQDTQCIAMVPVTIVTGV